MGFDLTFHLEWHWWYVPIVFVVLYFVIKKWEKANFAGKPGDGDLTTLMAFLTWLAALAAVLAEFLI